MSINGMEQVILNPGKIECPSVQCINSIVVMKIDSATSIRLNETNCIDFVKVDQPGKNSDGSLIDLKKCNSIYSARTTDPISFQLLQANVELKCFPAV